MSVYIAASINQKAKVLSPTWGGTSGIGWCSWLLQGLAPGFFAETFPTPAKSTWSGSVQPKKNIDLKKEHHLKQTSLTLGAKGSLKIPGCTEGTTSDIQHDPKGLLLLASKSS